MTKYTPRRRFGSILVLFGIVFDTKFVKFRTTIVKLRANFVPIIANRKTINPVLLARICLLVFFGRIPKSGFGTKLAVKNATDAKTLANSASRRSESNGRRPGPGFGQNPGETSYNCFFAYPSNPG